MGSKFCAAHLHDGRRTVSHSVQPNSAVSVGLDYMNPCSVCSATSKYDIEVAPGSELLFALPEGGFACVYDDLHSALKKFLRDDTDDRVVVQRLLTVPLRDGFDSEYVLTGATS